MMQTLTLLVALPAMVVGQTVPPSCLAPLAANNAMILACSTAIGQYNPGNATSTNNLCNAACVSNAQDMGLMKRLDEQGCFPGSNKSASAILDFAQIFACQRARSGQFAGEHCDDLLATMSNDDDDQNGDDDGDKCTPEVQAQITKAGCCSGSLMAASRAMKGDGDNLLTEAVSHISDVVNKCHYNVPEPCTSTHGGGSGGGGGGGGGGSSGGSSGGHSLSGGAIAGVVIACVAVVTMAGVYAMVLHNRARTHEVLDSVDMESVPSNAYAKRADYEDDDEPLAPF